MDQFFSSSEKQTRLAHSPSSPKNRNFYPKISYTYQKKINFSKQKIFPTRLKQLITWNAQQKN